MTDPITVFAIIESPPADMAAVISAVAELARKSIREPGCLRYDPQLSVKTPSRLILHEVWADEAALEQHRRMDHVAQFREVLDRTGAKAWASAFLPLT